MPLNNPAELFTRCSSVQEHHHGEQLSLRAVCQGFVRRAPSLNCTFSFIPTSLFLRQQVLRGKSQAYLKHCEQGHVRAFWPKLVSSFINDPLGEEGGKTQYEAGRPLRLIYRPASLSSFRASKHIRDTILNMSGGAHIMQLRWQWSVLGIRPVSTPMHFY